MHFSIEDFSKITTWKPGLDWDVAMEEMRRRKEIAKLMGGKERVDRHHNQGKLTIRERIDRLVDSNTFWEAGPMMGKGKYDENGDLIGFTPAGIEKHSPYFMMPMSYQYGIPCIHLSDGAGASAAAYEEANRMFLYPAGQWWWWMVTKVGSKTADIHIFLHGEHTLIVTLLFQN